MLFDSHAHLDDKRFSADLAEVITRAGQAGVTRMVTVGTGLESCAAAVSLAEEYKGQVFASIGIHPHDAQYADEAALEQLVSWTRSQAVVAIGETGLDYHYDNSPRNVQRAVFGRHIELALATGRPVIIHCREAYEDCLSVLREFRNRNLRGVAHCFSEGPSVAEQFLNLGFDISFAGTVTFPNADNIREAAKAVPLDRLLAETDCPYLSPVPLRGRRNEPAFVRHVIARLAELLGLETDELADITSKNAARLFGIV